MNSCPIARRALRYPNRTVVCLIALFCVVARACLAEDVASETPSAAEQQQQHAAELRGWATNVQFNPDGTVGLIRFSKPLVTDETLASLTHFPNLKYLAVVAPKVTDQGMDSLRHLKELDTLLLSETAITSSGLDAILQSRHLERLGLSSTRIDDAAGESLSKLEHLKTLMLDDTAVGDSTVKRLAYLQSLEALFLDETSVTSASCVHLAKLPHLKLLSMAGCQLQGEAFGDLRDSPSLTHLVLSGCNVDSASLESLASIATLKTMELYKTSLTAAEITSLRQAMPTVTIFSNSDDSSNLKRTQPANAPEQLAEVARTVEDRVLPAIVERLDEKTATIDFQRHVIPLLGRLGCNGRSCHGSFQGQGGFRLSMFGYDFEDDLANLLARIDHDQPDKSLMLQKPLSADEHEGGQRFTENSWQHRLLRNWILSGATGIADDAPTFQRLEVQPAEIIFNQPDQSQPLRVIAVWSNGLREDVTPLTRFETKDDAIATVSSDGLVQARGKGCTNVIAFYDNGIEATEVLMPIHQPSNRHVVQKGSPNQIDRFVLNKLSKLGIMPSGLSSDVEFLRRVSLDLIGTLPTPGEILAFVSDQRAEKRSAKINELLEHPAYVTWWTTRLCDLTGSNAGYLGNTEMAQPVAEQWRAWIERRVRDNVGWDRIARDIITSSSRPDGQSYRDFVKHQSRFTKSSEPEDFAAPDNPMPHFWFRDNIRIPSDKALSFGYVFMGLKLDCAQCHKHPFDRWSKKDFDLFTEFFTRIKTGLPPDALPVHDQYREMLGVPGKLNTAALRRQSYLRIAAEGRPIPWHEVYVDPPTGKPQPAKLLGDTAVDLSEHRDPRIVLADWLTNEPNRYLSKAFVNRIWANYFGEGIIAPTDDLNRANPPTNAALLDYLTEQFVRHEYDMKWLHREIVSSETYQRSWRPNDSNRSDRRFFSHAILRRLPAEVAVDAILQATASDSRIATIGLEVQSRKIGQHPKSYQTRSIDYSLLVFGKPLRTTNCDCERQDAPTLPQALYRRNDVELLEWIDRNDGWIAQLSRENPAAEQIDALLRAAYLRTVSRQPSDRELHDGREHVAASATIVDGMRDLVWALLNCQEFITNH